MALHQLLQLLFAIGPAQVVNHNHATWSGHLLDGFPQHPWLMQVVQQAVAHCCGEANRSEESGKQACCQCKRLA